MKIILNPDKEIVKEVRDGLTKTGGFCPCRVVKSADTKCMCKDFKEQTEAGECYCGLYIKVNS